MPSHQKMGVGSALLVSLNTIIGAGLFINIRPLTNIAGPFGFLGYLFGWVILFPFVLSLANLASLHPVSGGIYVYSKEYIHPLAGFLSGWSYFIGKATSGALLIHTFVKYFLQIYITQLQTVPTLLLDCIFIFALLTLHSIGVKIGGKIQRIFIFAKITPIAFVIIAGILYKSSIKLPCNAFNFGQSLSTIPIALFALVGFEIICSIAHLLKNPVKNTRRVIIGSSLIIVTLYTIFQLMFFLILKDNLGTVTDPLSAIATYILPNFPSAPIIINALVHASIIGSAFSILTSNSWNIYTLAQNEHLPLQKILTFLNKKRVPAGGLFFQGIISCLMLFLNRNQITLQNMSVFAIFVAFFLSAIAAFNAAKKDSPKNHFPVIPALAIGTCGYTLCLCFKKLLSLGVSIPFLTVLFSGIIIALFKHKNKHSIQTKS
jgi:amino acid transporter